MNGMLALRMTLCDEAPIHRNSPDTLTAQNSIANHKLVLGILQSLGMFVHVPNASVQVVWGT